MIIELWLAPLKPFALGAFIAWFFMRSLRKARAPRAFEIKEI